MSDQNIVVVGYVLIESVSYKLILLQNDYVNDNCSAGVIGEQSIIFAIQNA